MAIFSPGPAKTSPIGIWNDGPIDESTLGFSQDFSIVTISTTKLVMYSAYNDNYVTFTGSFTYSSAAVHIGDYVDTSLVTATITSIDLYKNSFLPLAANIKQTFSSLSISLSDLFAAAETDNFIRTVLSGNDTLNGTSFTGSGEKDFAGNTVTGDILDGYAGNDIIYGNGGNDSLWGDLGNDSLYGGTDNDRLYGGPGNDILNGGYWC